MGDEDGYRSQNSTNYRLRELAYPVILSLFLHHTQQLALRFYGRQTA